MNYSLPVTYFLQRRADVQQSWRYLYFCSKFAENVTSRNIVTPQPSKLVFFFNDFFLRSSTLKDFHTKKSNLVNSWMKTKAVLNETHDIAFLHTESKLHASVFSISTVSFTVQADTLKIMV